MNDLFDALLDISKLDAGVLTPGISDFPVNRLLKRVETTFQAAARDKGLRLRVVPSAVWVESDFILLERILLNLVSNAVHYTERGGIVIGCRRRSGRMRIDVCDSGIVIPENQRRNIFGEFYQLDGATRHRAGGLGLGLAIVDRLCALLDHPIELSSQVGRGSRFSVSVPAAPVGAGMTEAAATSLSVALAESGKLIVVIDDDEAVRESTRGLLQRWGCRVTAADCGDTILARLAELGGGPDLIICDYRLAHGRTGFELINRLRVACGAQIPAFLISGDTGPERLREAREEGYYLLHKPVRPSTLRSLVKRLLTDADAGIAVGEPANAALASRGLAAAASQAPPPQ
jgi:CheY-like chemotaxis protein